MKTKNLFRKSQASGASAAVLVAIIAALIVIYILFLPPESREALLEGDGTMSPGGVGPSVVETILIESPGRLDYVDQKEIEHALPAINLYTTTEAQLLKSIDSIYVKNGWFDKLFYNFTFPIENLGNTDNLRLVFLAKQRKGRLVIVLNGEMILNEQMDSLNIDPIRLPKELLMEENTISISVSGVGIKFWRTNEYSLKDLKITADVTDITTQLSKEIFIVTSTERDNVERAFLRFFPDCVPGTVGVLNINLNDHNVFSAVPDCGILRPLEISPRYLISGENMLSFGTTKGVYLIDQISVKTELKKMSYQPYYFELHPELFESIDRGNARVLVYLDFVNDIDYKKADVFVNGHVTHLDTRDRQWYKDISIYVAPGNNAVEIIPKTTMDIINLRVVLE